MNILITGITGFVGSHLARYCLIEKKGEVHGTILSHHSGEEEIRVEDIKEDIQLHECNLTNRIAVERVIKKVQPDVIFHLAAQSFVPTSWKSPEDTLYNNIFSELNIFEVLRDLQLHPPIVLACSSEEYGLVKDSELPVKETNPLRPLSPYAVSKVAQEKLGFQYYHSYGTKAILTRFFNIEGPGRGQDFVISNFAKQIAEIENGQKDPILDVGNLQAKRDFTDVRDAVRAYWISAEKCHAGEPYNICSGVSHSIKSALDILLGMSTRSDIQIKQDPTRMRPSDVQVLLGDYTKFHQQTGWTPSIPFEKTVQDTLEYWRKHV